MVTPVKAYSEQRLKQELQKANIPAFRASQIFNWVYEKGVTSYDEMTNLPKVMREQLATAYPLLGFNVKEKRESVDGSRKYLIEFHDGVCVEAVGLPDRENRLTVCCSSQSGCAMACAFCATGKEGFVRNLLPGEIVDQVRAVQDDYNQRVTNVVVMGQGEPFANYEATMDALKIINHPKLLNIGARHITVSTCGLVNGIERFMKEQEQYTLAVSLHSAIQKKRDLLMPGVKEQRLGTLRKALDDYTKATGRRFSFEYALIDGLNDGTEDFEALVSYCRRLFCHVNLIPLNEVENSLFVPAPKHRMREWRDGLEEKGIPTSIRLSRGADIAGACGQLKSLVSKNEYSAGTKLLG